jgi:hypothetical protein
MKPLLYHWMFHHVAARIALTMREVSQIGKRLAHG